MRRHRFTRTSSLALSGLLLAGSLGMVGAGASSAAADPRTCGRQLSDWQTLGAASEYTGPFRSFGPNGNNPYGQVSVTLLLGQGTVVSTANSRLNLSGPARFGDDFANAATLRITGRNSAGALGTWILEKPVCLDGSTRVVATNASLSVGSFSVEGRVTRAL